MSIWKNPSFVAYAANRTLNVMGMHGFTVAIGWHVYKLTGDPLDLGLIGLAQFAPVLALFLVAGVTADRVERRLILIATNIVQVSTVGSILAVMLLGLSAMPVILAILVVHGAARAFYHPASQAVLPNLVVPDQFSQAIAISSSANKAAQLIGPAVGGALIAWIGDGVYPALMAFFALGAAAALVIKPGANVRRKEPISLSSILGGFAYVWRDKIVLGAISIDLLAVLFGGVMGLLPVYAKDILNVGPAELGLMRSMPAIGSLCVGMVLMQVTHPRHMGPAMFVSLACFGASIVVFGMSETFWISLAALAAYGGADMISVYVRQTLVQIATPDDMRGRVSAVNSVSINASNELGDFRAGVTAAAIGTVPAVVVGGVVTLAVTGLWVLLFPTIRRVDRL
ncbi:MAG: MFS transporter [Rhodospirillaceae bacterium]